MTYNCSILINFNVSKLCVIILLLKEIKSNHTSGIFSYYNLSGDNVKWIVCDYLQKKLLLSGFLTAIYLPIGNDSLLTNLDISDFQRF